MIDPEKVGRAVHLRLQADAANQKVLLTLPDSAKNDEGVMPPFADADKEDQRAAYAAAERQYVLNNAEWLHAEGELNHDEWLDYVRQITAINNERTKK